jgi:hypothetical protein
MDQLHVNESGLSAKMALCLAAMTLVGIDGEFLEEELTKLRGFIHSDESAFLKAFSFYNDHSIDICRKVVTARLNTEQKRMTYRVLFDLAHSDKEIAKSEETLLQQYASDFGLTKDFIAVVNTTSDLSYDLKLFE